MLRWVRRILLGVLALLLLLVLLVCGAGVALNAAAGRGFAEAEINKFAASSVKIAGLGGHFPADIKITHVSLLDKDGTWLDGDGLELRWQPLQLLRWHVLVEALTAEHIEALRTPAAGEESKNSGGGGSSLPLPRVDVERLEIGTLHVAAGLAGEDVVLHVAGAAHMRDAAHVSAVLDAATPDGAATYHVSTAMDSENVNLDLHVSEPPDGLIGHYAGPQVQAPLLVDVRLEGPRAKAALDAALSLGTAALNVKGTLGLDQSAPFADVTFTVPALAPFGAMASQDIGGSTQAHLVIAQQKDGSARVALDGKAAITQAPGNLTKFLGPEDVFSLLATLEGKTVSIDHLSLGGKVFSALVTGSVSQDAIDLSSDVKITDVSTLSPSLKGGVEENGTVKGSPKDFAADVTLTGDVRAGEIPSSPFNIKLEARHLPGTPEGTLTGSGALENSPLKLDASFARTAGGEVGVKIPELSWRSLSAEADLHLAAGAQLPTGTAKLSLRRLDDLSPLSPVKLQGALDADFAYADGNALQLNVKGQRLVVAPSLGAIDATVNAAGKIEALGVRAQVRVAQIAGAPLQASLAGTLDVPAQSAHLASFGADWHGLDARLTGPADIETKPGIAVRHLSLGLAGGSVALDGTLTPALNANARVQNFPVSIVKDFVPSVDATGMVSATAGIKGSIQAPQGTVTLNASALHMNSGVAATIPPANITGRATLNGKSADTAIKLDAGPNIALAVQGTVPLQTTGPMNLRVNGMTDLRLADAILAARGSVARGVLRLDIALSGTPQAPQVNGTLNLGQGSFQDIGSGLSLTGISAAVNAAGKQITLNSLKANAGKGVISGHGRIDLGAPEMPVDFVLNADNATPVSSDLVTETLDAALTLKGGIQGSMALGGNIKILKADINIPHGLPPSVANLPILNEGEKPPPPPAPPPAIALSLDVRAENQIFIRGDGLFAEFGGHLRIDGTAAAPEPLGGFTLIRGNFSLAGKNLQFTSGKIGFNGGGFVPTLDLEATANTSNNGTATLVIGGTAAKPVITLTSSPPLPSDEILAQLLFAQSASSLTPFQAASLAAALAQLAGLGGGTSPLDKVRGALGLDELSINSNGSGPPSIQAGRYVAPGVYVGATQATNGQGTQADVQINLYKGLKLETATGTGSTGANSSSVGLTYQFNY